LELELLVWKQAHSVALEASEREMKSHNVQIAALNRQISNMDGFKAVRRFQTPCLRKFKSNAAVEPKRTYFVYYKWG